MQAFRAPDARGHIADITLGHDSIADYATYPNHFGVHVGRFAKRLRSENGDKGYPGTLDIRVTHSLDERGELEILFETTSDAPTIVRPVDQVR